MDEITPTTYVTLTGDWFSTARIGQPAALYVMVAAGGSAAKIGALERAENALDRAKAVDRKQRSRLDDEAQRTAYVPLRLAIVAELEGLVLGPYDTPEFDERWAEVEHVEAALRLGLARRLGNLSRWTDWIDLDEPVPDAAWRDHVEHAWRGVTALGRSAD